MEIKPLVTNIEINVSALNSDSGELEFTGFVTNARVIGQCALEGEVWRHQRASLSGEFADGHRIQTSRIVEVHVVNNSVWVDTETGSRYGILSFSPTSLRDLLRLLDKRAHRDVIGGGSVHEKTHEVTKAALSNTRPKRRPAARLNSEGRHPFRPPANPDYIPKVKAHFDKKMAGIRAFQRECALRTASPQSPGNDEPPVT